MVAAKSKYPPILVRRYARHRLYDGVAGRYVAVDDLRQWLKDGVAFEVRDSETGEHVTRAYCWPEDSECHAPLSIGSSLLTTGKAAA
jgi:polyhydroxyalkanoate synthesis regulator protein